MNHPDLTNLYKAIKGSGYPPLMWTLWAEVLNAIAASNLFLSDCLRHQCAVCYTDGEIRITLIYKAANMHEYIHRSSFHIRSVCRIVFMDPGLEVSVHV